MENVLGGAVAGDGSDPVDLVPDVRVHMVSSRERERDTECPKKV